MMTTYHSSYVEERPVYILRRGTKIKDMRRSLYSWCQLIRQHLCNATPLYDIGISTTFSYH